MVMAMLENIKHLKNLEILSVPKTKVLGSFAGARMQFVAFLFWDRSLCKDPTVAGAR